MKTYTVKITLNSDEIKSDMLAELERSLNSAVREYDAAIMRTPLDEDEIRRAVNKCASAREKFNTALTRIEAKS
jgi:chromosome condensin MukBEF ATPase and DNA-binding subunit MukB